VEEKEKAKNENDSSFFSPNQMNETLRHVCQG